jgi:hypothetical protein
MNRRRQVLVYVGNVSILGESINTVNKRIEAPLQTNKEDGLEVNADKTNYVIGESNGQKK